VGTTGVSGFATWRGVILGYCSNCALTYEGERGIGFFEHGVEIRFPDTPSYAISAFDTYLKNVNLETVGDIEANPEDTIENHERMEADIPNIVADFTA